MSNNSGPLDKKAITPLSEQPNVSINDVRDFWDAHPLCASAIPFPIGTPEYFRYYDRLRETIEPKPFQDSLHEFKQFSGKRVADLGCGNGYILKRYAEANAEVHGVDLTPKAIELSKARFFQAQLPGNFLVANIEQLPFPDAFFDCVCCVGVLHHLPSPEKTVREIFRVLKPGGLAAVMVYHRDSALYQFKFPLLSFLQGKRRQILVNEVDGVGNPKGAVYSRSELKELFREFQIMELFIDSLQGWMVLPKFGKFIPNVLLKPLAKRWGWFLYAKARKPTG